VALRVAIGGAGQGIGAACARLLAKQGARLLLCARTGADVSALAAALRKEGAEAHWLAADLATDSGAEAFASGAFRALGGVDFALVCVGNGHPKVAARAAGRALLLSQFEQNAVAPALAAGALLRAWDREDGLGAPPSQRRGPSAASDRHLLVLSSLVTRHPPLAGTAPYTAGKAALESLVRALAEESWPRARINALCLGAVATRQHERAGTPAAEIAGFPSADEAAQVIAHLWGPLAAGLSGRCLDADLLTFDPVTALAGDGRLALAPPLQPPPGAELEAPPEAEPGRRPSPRVRAALRAGASQLHRHPVRAGELAVRLADLVRLRPTGVLLSGGGATELLERCLRALCAPGDEVVSPFPCYELLPALCTRQGLRHRPVLSATGADGLFGPTLAAPLIAAVGPRTRLVYLASPDNPTGALLLPEEEALLRQGLGPAVTLVLDEAWSLEPLAPPPPVTAGVHARLAPVVRLRSFSKLLGLAGLRLGFALADAGPAEVLRRLELPFPVGTPQLEAALAALGEPERLRRAALLLARERGRTVEALRSLGLSVGAGTSPVLLVRDGRPGGRAGPLLFALRAAGVPVMEAEWDPAALVLGLGTRAENRRAVAALGRALGARTPE
jgi:histidinol-phosphate aminotransferase